MIFPFSSITTTERANNPAKGPSIISTPYLSPNMISECRKRNYFVNSFCGTETSVCKGRSLEIANTIVLSISAASLLNVRTDVAHTLVSRLGKMFRTTRLPFSLAKVNSDKSVFTNEKSGATEPTEGRLPLCLCYFLQVLFCHSVLNFNV